MKHLWQKTSLWQLSTNWMIFDDFATYYMNFHILCESILNHEGKKSRRGRGAYISHEGSAKETGNYDLVLIWIQTWAYWIIVDTLGGTDLLSRVQTVLVGEDDIGMYSWESWCSCESSEASGFVYDGLACVLYYQLPLIWWGPICPSTAPVTPTICRSTFSVPKSIK